MSQAHFLPPLSSTTTNGANNNNGRSGDDLENDLQIIKVTLENNKHLIVALPTFDADGSNCPSVATLMGKYNIATSSSSAVGGSLPALDFSNGGVGMIAGVVLGSNNNGSNAGLGLEASSTSHEKLSVSDAFGQLQIVEDLPLAPLQPAPPLVVADEEVVEESIAIVETTTAEGGEEDDFGNFEGVQEPASAANEDDFGDFDNAPSHNVVEETEFTPNGNNEEEEEVLTSNDAVSNDNEQMEQLNSVELVEEEEDFGGFAVARSGHDEIKTESSTAEDDNDDENSDFGSFGDGRGTEDDGLSLGQNNVVTAPATMTTSAFSLNGGDGAALGNDDGGHNMLSISDAFDPSLIVVSEHGTNVGGGMDESNSNNVASSSANPLAAADLERSVDGFGIAAFPEQAIVSNNSDKLSVFDALVDVQDAPLPSLGGAFTSSTSSSNNDEMAGSDNAEEEDDDFGDFSGHGNEDAADDIEDAGQLEDVHEEEDHFGDFEGTSSEERADENEVEVGDIQDAGLGEVLAVGDFGISSEILQPDADNFGDFDAAATDEVTAGGEKAELTSNHEGGVEIITETVQLNGNTSDKDLSVFDVFAEVQDAPLPSLSDNIKQVEDEDDFGNFLCQKNNEVAVSDIENSELEAVKDEEADFGNSGGIAAYNVTSDNLDKGLSMFDVLTEVQDPLPSLGSFPSMSEEAGDGNDNQVDNDEFGDFEASDQTAAAAENNEMFGETYSDKEFREEAHEAPLPSSGICTSATEAEDFRNFKDTNRIDDVESAPAVESGDDLFDAFSSSNTPLPASDILDEASFGTFEGSGVGTSLVRNADSNGLATYEKEDVSFGDFNANVDASDQAGGDLFAGDVGASNTVMNANDVEEEFGEFGGAFTDTNKDTKIHVAKENDTEIVQVNEEVSFGEFGDFPHVTDEAANNNSNNDFGKFETTSPVIDGNEEESFGQFNAMGKNDDTDFGLFEGTGTTHLPEDAVPDNTVPDEAFGDGFGDFSSFDEGVTSQPTGDLEDILRCKLGDEFSKLAADWKHVIVSTVEHDVQRGNKILDYILNNLSFRERALITKSRKLRDHILSLGEMVRLVRYITATIGELLCVDKNIEVQESTLSQWDDNAVIADAVVIDYIWSEIAVKAARMDIELPQLESVVEIRSAGALPFDSHQRGHFCELTLWPLTLKEDVSTVSPVSWNGKRYMACAANFCANRLPVQAAESF